MGNPMLPTAEVLEVARGIEPGSVLATVPPEATAPEIEAHLRQAEGPSMFSGAIGLAVVSISFAYLGWATAAEVAGEIRRPGRNLPLAILGSVVVVGTLYLLMNVVYTAVIPPAAMVEVVEVNGEPLLQPIEDIGSVVATHLLGQRGGMLVTGALVFLFVSTLSTGIMTGGRVIAALSWRGELPRRAGELNHRGAPTIAVFSMLALTLPIVWSSSLASLFEYVGLLTTLAMMMAMVSIIAMRWKAPDLPRPFRIPLYPVPPLISLGIGVWLIASALMDDWLEVLYAGLTVLAIVVLRPFLIRPVESVDASG